MGSHTGCYTTCTEYIQVQYKILQGGQPHRLLHNLHRIYPGIVQDLLGLAATQAATQPTQNISRQSIGSGRVGRHTGCYTTYTEYIQVQYRIWWSGQPHRVLLNLDRIYKLSRYSTRFVGVDSYMGFYLVYKTNTLNFSRIINYTQMSEEMK